MITRITTDSKTKEVLINFSVSDNDKKVSLALFSTTGKYITGILSGVSYKKGTHLYRWDKKDFLGNAIPPGSYKIGMGEHKIKFTVKGYIGNSSESNSVNRHTGYKGIADFAVTDDFILYCNTYDERKPKQWKCPIGNTGIRYRASNVGDDTPNSYLMCSDNTYGYWFSYNYDDGPPYTFIFKTDINTGAVVPFTNGVNSTWKGVGYSSVKLPKKPADINGNYGEGYILNPAVQKTGNAIVVPYPVDNSVSIVHKVTGQTLQLSISFTENIRAVCFDASDVLWIAFEHTVKKYTVASNGALSYTSGYDYNTATSLSAVSVAPNNSYFCVADVNGQQVKGYSVSSGALLWTDGIAGGYNGNPSVAGRLSIDHKTRIIAANNGYRILEDFNNRILFRSFTGTILDEIIYQPASYETASDLGDASRAFVELREFKVDVNAPLIFKDGNGHLFRNWSKGTYVRFSSVVTFGSNGTYALVNKSNVGGEFLVKLDPVLGIVETGVVLSSNGPQMNPGGIYEFGPNLNIGEPSIYYKRSITFSNGSIVVGNQQIIAQRTKQKNDPSFGGNGGSASFGEFTEDGLLLTMDEQAGYNNPGLSETYHTGGLNPATGNYDFMTSYATGHEYRGDFPQDERWETGNGGNNQNNYSGTRLRNINGKVWTVGQKCEYWRDGQVNKYKLFYKNGLFLDVFGKDYTEFKRSGSVGMEGNANQMHVNPLPGGKCRLRHGGESFGGGITEWEGTGFDTVVYQEIAISLNADPANLTYDGKIDLMQGIGSGTVQGFVNSSATRWTRTPAVDHTNYEGQDQFVVRQNQQDVNNPSLSMTVRRYQNSEASVSANISLQNLDSWRLSADLKFYDQPSQTINGGGRAQFILSDANNKALVVVDYRFAAPYNLLKKELVINNVRFWHEEYGTIFYPEDFNSIEITQSAGKLFCVFGNRKPQYINPYDSQADVSSLGKFIMYHVQPTDNVQGYGLAVRKAVVYYNEDFVSNGYKYNNEVASYAALLLEKPNLNGARSVRVVADETHENNPAIYLLWPDNELKYIPDEVWQKVGAAVRREGGDVQIANGQLVLGDSDLTNQTSLIYTGSLDGSPVLYLASPNSGAKIIFGIPGRVCVIDWRNVYQWQNVPGFVTNDGLGLAEYNSSHGIYKWMNDIVFHSATADASDQGHAGGFAWTTAFANGNVFHTSNKQVMYLSNSGLLQVGSDSGIGGLLLRNFFRFLDGNQAAGKVLASDASGNASWQTPTGPLSYYAQVTTAYTALPADTWTRIQYQTIVVNTLGVFDASSNEYVIPATGTYVSVLKFKMPDNTGTSKSYGFGTGTVDADNPDVKWQNGERTAPTNRNMAINTTYFNATAGQRIKSFVFLDGWSGSSLAYASWTVYKLPV